MDNLSRERRLARWLNGELPEEETRRLAVDLREDAAFLNESARSLIVERHLAHRRLQPVDFTAQVLGVLSVDEPATDSVTSVVIAKLQIRERRRRFLLRGSIAATVAAILVLVLSLLFQTKMWMRPIQPLPMRMWLRSRPTCLLMRF